MSMKAIGKAQTLTSMEVAEMTGREHKEMLRDIRRYEKYLGESKIAQSDFWIENTYHNSQNKKQPCYDITKKGCEFIAHKMTGQKGTVFTALYINRFHEMEDALKEKKDIGLPAEMNRAMLDLITKQMDVLQRMSERLERLEHREKEIIPALLKDGETNAPALPEKMLMGRTAIPFIDSVDERISELNDLINEIIVRSKRKRNSFLRNLYRQIESDMGITLDCYLYVAKKEYRDDISTLHAIAYFDELFFKTKDLLECVLEYARTYWKPGA